MRPLSEENPTFGRLAGTATPDPFQKADLKGYDALF
jgi:hypothetical protein